MSEIGGPDTREMGIESGGGRPKGFDIEHQLATPIPGAEKRGGAGAGRIGRLKKRGKGGSSGVSAEEMRRMMGFGELPRIEVEGRDESIFNLDFLKKHGLPDTIYVPGITKLGYANEGQDVLSLITTIYKTGTTPPELAFKYIKDAIKSETHGAEAMKKINEAQEAWQKFRDGVIPLILFRIRNKEGYLSTYGGDSEKGIGGLLEPLPPAGRNSSGIDINLVDIVAAWKDDALAKRALAIFEYADGMDVGNMNKKDKKFAERYKKRFNAVMSAQKGEEGYYKANGSVQADMVAKTGQIAKEVAKYLRCDEGRVQLMFTLYTILGGPQMVGEYRELWQDYPVLQDHMGAVNSFENGDDVMMKRLIVKLKPGDDEIGFGYASERLKNEGVDGLFDSLLKLKDPHLLWKYWSGAVFVLSTMKKIKLMQDGKDSFPDASKRGPEIAKLAEALGQGDPPQITKETVEAIKKMPFYKTKGVLFKAGQQVTMERETAIIASMREDVLDTIATINKPAKILDKTPLGRLKRRLRRG